MNPSTQHLQATLIVMVCLALIILAYLLGFEVGKSTALLSHPGYDGTGHAGKVSG